MQENKHIVKEEKSDKKIKDSDRPEKDDNDYTKLKEDVKKLKNINHCEICGTKEWLGKPIALELHHKNGVNTDNRLENLVILCPNCHSQTDNYRGRAKLSALSEMRDVEYRKFRETLTDNADGNPEPSLNNEEGAETRHDTPKE